MTVEPGPGGNNFPLGFHAAQRNGHAPNARYDALGELREHLRRRTTTPAGYFDRRSKHLASRLLAGLLFVLGLPIMLGAMLLVRLTSPGPAIYRQARVGKGGKTFVMYKIRSMGRHAEAASGPVWTKRRDPRITPVGRCIRLFHLDELPQLINVLKGEMSLVGPRPERPEFVRHLVREVSEQR
jgi:lipopolysaccharide/colanic/teichoic acid biosynthesis glycosyltransferase